MREIWAPVTGYEGLYEVSNMGAVKRLQTESTPGTGHYARPERILSQKVNNKGYKMVDLWKSNRRKQFLVHRLVAAAFLENDDGFSVVNHKDENKQNNMADNLEWCTQAYNMNYGTCPTRIGKANGKPVVQLKLDGVAVAVHPSIMQAQRNTGIPQGSIGDCLHGRRKTAGGHLWEYEK